MFDSYPPLPHTLSVEIRTTEGRVVSTFVLTPPAGVSLRGQIDPISSARPRATTARTAIAITLTPAQVAALRTALAQLDEA